MKKLLSSGIALLLVMGLTSFLIASTNNNDSTKKNIGNLNGTITAIDITAKNFSIKSKKGDFTFIFTELTTVQGNGKKSIDDLKVGDKLTVRYQRNGNTRIAMSLKILK